jgi:predicted Ser/Thr protein kinase
MRICKECRQPLPENAPEGLCPACLAKVALRTEPAAPGATITVNPLPDAEPGTRVPPNVGQLATQFPQLEIIELLGMGGMGMVYKARQPRLDRFVALKILPVESAQHPSFAERFNREAKALAKLNHPGIVAVYDFGQTGQYYYFVMEYVDGMNLRRLLNDQPVTPRQALDIVVQICTALQYAHDKGVVHRDIKPENILINKEGQVKIADFGLAKLLGAAPDTALTMSQAAMGTFNYMAPEQRENAQKVDHRADIYSLGVVFYEMLTGEVPMGRFEPPSKKVQVDVRLDEVVLKALEREPARRYQHASEVKTGVEAITSSGPEASPTPIATKPGPATSGRRVPISVHFQELGLFCAGWFAIKLFWNLGSLGCWLGCFGMATLVIWATQRRFHFFPDELALGKARLSKMSFFGKMEGVTGAFLGLSLGFACLIGASLNLWEQYFPFASNKAARTAEQYEALYQGKEYHLLQRLPAFSHKIPSVELAPQFVGGDSFGLIFGWGVHGPGHHNSNLLPNLIVGCLLVAFFTLGCMNGIRVVGSAGTRSVCLSWPLVRQSGSILLNLSMGMEIIMIIAIFGFLGGTHTIQPMSRDFMCRTNIDAVTTAIQNWADQNGYAIGNAKNWDVNTVPIAKRVAQARIREAWKPSPFDRWRSTWISFRRVSPYLAFDLVSSEDPAETDVIVAGTDAIFRGATVPEDQQIPEDLISALKKLESPQRPAPGGMDSP